MNKRLTFVSFDGTLLHGVLSLPEAKIIAGVLLLHGCPSEKNEDGFYSEEPDTTRKHKKVGGMAEYLASAGIASLRFDFREHGENERTIDMRNLTISGMINDVESGYRELKSQLPSHIPVHVAAASFSGGIAVKWMNNFNNDVEHLFLLAPLLDMPYTIRKLGVIEHDKRGVEQLCSVAVEALETRSYLDSGGKKMNRSFLNEIMTMNIEREFQQIKSPVTIIHGAKDTVVPLESSKYFASKCGSQCELCVIEKAVHGFGIENDTEWEEPQSLKNHELVYDTIIKRIRM